MERGGCRRKSGMEAAPEGGEVVAADARGADAGEGDGGVDVATMLKRYLEEGPGFPGGGPDVPPCAEVEAMEGELEVVGRMGIDLASHEKAPMGGDDDAGLEVEVERHGPRDVRLAAGVVGAEGLKVG